MGNLMERFEVDGKLVELDSETVKSYLVNGNGKVTDKEVAMFINLCKYQGLNPFVREAYLIKYDDKSPAQTVVGKDAFTRRAAQIPECNGWQAGVAVVGAKNEYIEREGTIVLPGEKLVGGWCTVEREQWKPFKVTVDIKEYNTGKSMWAKMPATMIRKVAIVQALRESFPDKFQGMYDQSEIGTDEGLPESDISDINELPINNAKKKAISDLIGKDKNRIDTAKAVIGLYKYSSIADVKNKDYESIMQNLQEAFTPLNNDVIDIEPNEPEQIEIDDSDMPDMRVGE